MIPPSGSGCSCSPAVCRGVRINQMITYLTSKMSILQRFNNKKLAPQNFYRFVTVLKFVFEFLFEIFFYYDETQAIVCYVRQDYL